MAELRHEIHKKQPFDNLEQETFLNLLRTADALSREMEELFKPSELSPTQYNVLRILRGAGTDGLPCGQIGDRMITRDPDMTRLLDRLEKRQWIVRSRDTADRRVVRARITHAASNLLAELDAPLLAMHRQQLAHMGAQRLRQLKDLLELARSRPGIPAGPGTCDGH